MTREMNLYVPEINAGRGAGCVIRIHFQKYRDLIFLKKPTVCGFETRWDVFLLRFRARARANAPPGESLS